MTQKVLLYTSALTESLNEISSVGGSVPLQFSDRVFVALLPNDFDIKGLKFSSHEKPGDLDENSVTMAHAWRITEKRINEKKLSKSETNMSNDDEEIHQYPRSPKYDMRFKDTMEKNGIVGDTSTPTSMTMNGKIAVGVLVVSGPTKDLQFTLDENTKVLTEVMEGLDFLSSYCFEAEITYVITSFYISISALPSATDCNTDPTACENVFRNPTLEILGYQQTYDGVVALVNTLKASNNTDWSYVTFFTKYPIYNFAYQYGVNIYMQYSNGSLGPDKINNVFAQQTCHQFGAEYEFASSNCTCADSGVYDSPNNNCVNCSYTPKVTCLMNTYDLTMCNWTQGQLGWGFWYLPFRNILMNSGSVVASPSSPAMAFFKGIMYMAIRTADNKIKFIGTDDGYNWSNVYNTIEGVTTIDSPTLTTFDNKLYLAWRGTDNNIYYTFSYDGYTWNNVVNFIYVNYTSAAPCLTTLNGVLYLFWTAADDSGGLLCYGYSTDGYSFATNNLLYIKAYSPNAPACIGFDNKLFVFWKSAQSKYNIYYSYSTDGIRWTPSINLSGQSTTAALGLAVFNDRLYIAFKSQNSYNWVYYGSSKDGLSWGPNFAHVDSTSTSAAPSIAGFGTKYLNMAIKSTASDNEILVDYYFPGLF